MQNNRVRDIRQEFADRYKNGAIYNNMISIIGASFEVDEDEIFGEVNPDYVDAEIMWYESKSTKVKDLFRLYGKEVKIWKEISSRDGEVNSNYGHLVYSYENGDQYNNVVKKLCQHSSTRQASMIYQRPSMHSDWNRDGMMDFTCTNAVTYYIENSRLHAVVQMRSNDVVFGFNNDYAWQCHVWTKLINEVNYIRDKIGLPKLYLGKMTWQVQNLHMYARHFPLIEEYIKETKDGTK
jgi:thymidylate synthase